jgi:hypothetical protein
MEDVRTKLYLKRVALQLTKVCMGAGCRSWRGVRLPHCIKKSGGDKSHFVNLKLQNIDFSSSFSEMTLTYK